MHTSPTEQAAHLRESAAALADAVAALPPAARAEKMNSQWTVREVLAHLIGWNRLYVTGCQEILAGRLPPYYADPGPDFSRINAVLVARHGRGDIAALLAELRASADDLASAVEHLAPAAWAADHGARRGERVLTVQAVVDELIEDYGHHQGQLPAR